MGVSGRNTFSFSIKRSNRSLDGARKKLVKHLNNTGVNDDIQSQIDLAFYEVIANIIEHAGDDFSNEDVFITCMFEMESVDITIRYRGLEFDITRAPMPDVKEHVTSGKDGGLGIYIVRTLMDRVVYSHENELNTIILIKKNR